MKNLLILEEDREGRETLARVLKQRGFRVIEAADEEGALALIRSMKGISLLIAGATQEDRAAFLVDLRDQRPDLPVVFLTDYCWPEAILRSLRFGAFGVLRRLNMYLNLRPVAFAELERLLLTILYGRSVVSAKRPAAA